MNAPSVAMWFAVAGGGALGSLARFGTGLLLARSDGFPIGTLVVNVFGSFLIGVFARVFVPPDQDHLLRLALTTGFCGGFTTFSTFSAETITLLQQGKAGRAMLYVALSLTMGLAATWLGLMLAKPRG